jgi:hypothetical protein
VPTRQPGLALLRLFSGGAGAWFIVKDTDPPNDPAHGLVLGKKKGSFANADGPEGGRHARLSEGRQGALQFTGSGHHPWTVRCLSRDSTSD